MKSSRLNAMPKFYLPSSIRWMRTCLPLPLLLVLLANWILACSPSVLPMWRPFLDNGDELYRFIQNGRSGFIHRSGRIVIPPTLPLVYGVFSDGVLVYGPGNSAAAIDTRGRVLFGPRIGKVKVSYVSPFRDGLAIASGEDLRFNGFIDRQGNFVIPPKYPGYPRGLVQSFSEGLAGIEVDGQLGYIDQKGVFAIAQHFAAGLSFSEGYAAVVDSGPCLYLDSSLDPCQSGDLTAPQTGKPVARPKNSLPRCRWSFIDKSGHRAFQGEFEAARSFSDGLAAVAVDGKWGYIDTRGRFVIPPTLVRATSFSEGLAWIETLEPSTVSKVGYGYIDRSGRMQMRAGWPPLPFAEGVVPAFDSGRWIFMGKDGRQAVPGRYLQATGFFHGLAHVQLDGKPGGIGRYAYIDHRGTIVFQYYCDIIIR